MVFRINCKGFAKIDCKGSSNVSIKLIFAQAHDRQVYLIADVNKGKALYKGLHLLWGDNYIGAFYNAYQVIEWWHPLGQGRLGVRLEC